MITAIEVTENQTIRTVNDLVNEFGDVNVHVFTATLVATRFRRDFRRCLREIMDILRSHNNSVVILAYAHLWLNEISTPESTVISKIHADISDDDTDDEEEFGATAVQGFNSNSLGLLYNLCHWVSTLIESNCKLYIVLEHKVPKRLSTIPGLVIVEKLLFSRDGVESSLSHATLPPVSNDGLIVIGVIGTVGKTSKLRSLSNDKSVWMFSHEIVNCELGESPRIIRSLFETASGREKPSMVVLDDADLILSSSGRIMREIIEEICTCVSGDFARGYFLYSSRTRDSIPDVLLANTNQFIELDP